MLCGEEDCFFNHVYFLEFTVLLNAYTSEQLNRCGVADAKCAGVEVAHDGYCNLWELDTNVGSTMAIRAAQSLQLVHILWLVVAGLLVVLGSV